MCSLCLGPLQYLGIAAISSRFCALVSCSDIAEVFLTRGGCLALNGQTN